MCGERRTLTVVVTGLLTLTGVLGHGLAAAQPASACDDFCPLVDAQHALAYEHVPHVAQPAAYEHTPD